MPHAVVRGFRGGWGASAVVPVFAVTVVGGILLGYHEAPPICRRCVWIMLAAVAAARTRALRLSRKKRVALGWVVLAAMGASLGELAMMRIDRMAVKSIARYAGHDVVVYGTVLSVAPHDNPLELVVESTSVFWDGCENQVVGAVRIRPDVGCEDDWVTWTVRVGDVVSARVRLEHAGCPLNPGEPDYRMILLQKGIHAIGWAGCDSVEFAGRNTHRPVLLLAGGLRRCMSATAAAALESPERELLIGMMFGDSCTIDPETLGAFRRSGVAHLLAASGLHVGLVYGLSAAIAIMVGASPRSADAVAVIAGGLYAVSAGMRASVVRAWLMLAATVAARAGRRKASPIHVLLASASIQLLINPLLLWNAGFQMSYLAVFAIFGFSFIYRRRTGSASVGPFARIAMLIAASAAIQALTWPVVANMTGQVCLIGPVTNLVAVPLASVAMLAGLAGCAIGHLLPQIGMVIVSGVGVILRILVFFVRRASSLPLAVMTFRQLNAFEIGTYYATTVILSWLVCDVFARFRMSRRIRRMLRMVRRKPAIVAIIAVAILAGTTVWPRPFQAVFLSVGQGDSAVLLTPEGHTVLVDVGTERAGERSVLPYLTRRGIRMADVIVLTHEHRDHVGGLASLAGNVRAGAVVLPEGMDEAHIGHALSMLSCNRFGMSPLLFHVAMGDRIQVGSVGFDVMNPFSNQCNMGSSRNTVAGWSDSSPAPAREGYPSVLAFRDPNEASLVLRASCGEFSMLLCADAGREFEEEVVRRVGMGGGGNVGAQVLKVAHHGSSGSTSSEFLAAVNPAVAVISVGRNSYGHPAPDTVDRLLKSGAAVFCTDEVGAVTVSCCPRCRRMTVRSMREEWLKAPMFRKLEAKG